MENLFEQHIERMEKLQSVYEPHTGQHNILGMLINECKQALHKHGVSGQASAVCDGGELLPLVRLARANAFGLRAFARGRCEMAMAHNV